MTAPKPLFGRETTSSLVRGALLSGCLVSAGACTPAGPTTDNAKLDQLQSSVDALATEVSALKSEIESLRQGPRPPAPGRGRTHLDRDLGGTSPDLKDPFAPKVDPGPPTPLPQRGTVPSSRVESNALSELVESIKCDEGQCSYSAKAMRAALEDPASLTRSARIIPRVQDGVASGLKLYGIRPRSLPYTLGLKNGDTLVSVNGESLGGAAAAMDAYAKLSKKIDPKADPIELLIERKGRHHTLKLIPK